MDENVKEQLQVELVYVRNELEAERQQGQYGSVEKIAQLEQRERDILAKQEVLEKQEITQRQAEYNGGLKEVIFQVFDAVIPVEAGNVAFGINDFQEKGETFRQMIDLALDDNNATLHDYITELLEAKDAKIREQNALIIDLGVKLQEAERKEQYATENYDRAVAENERLEQEVVLMGNNAAEKDVENADLNEQLKAKEEQIAKLTEEINKPKSSGIFIPSQTKPSVALQQMMEAAKGKSIKSQVELAISGENFRGKVQLTSPPLLGGGETATETFQGQDTEANVTNGGVSATEENAVNEFKVPSLHNTPSEEGHRLDQEDVGLGMAGEAVTRQEYNELAARVALLEQSQRSVA